MTNTPDIESVREIGSAQSQPCGDVKNARTGLRSLLERVEAATGPDRELDCLLWSLDSRQALEWQGSTLVAGETGVIGWIDPGKYDRNFYTNRDVRGPGSIPNYTASLDAALALVERALPGWWLQHLGHDLAGWGVRIERQGLSIPIENRLARGATPALAILAALLRALLAAGEAQAASPASQGPGLNSKDQAR